MPEEDLEKTEEEGSPDEEQPKSRRFLTRRNGLLLAVGLGVVIVILGLLSVGLYRYGTLDSIIKAQFVDKMNYIGIEFTADVFRVTVNPLQLELKNATFNDKVTGDKLGFIREARLGLTIDDLFAWQLTRD
ncbi:MAG TPA: hypothetical protein VFZ49_02365, partial [Pyrinomonadaceae bacterium]